MADVPGPTAPPADGAAAAAPPAGEKRTAAEWKARRLAALKKPEHECNELGRKSAACLSVIGVTGISCEDELQAYYACLQTVREKRRDKGLFSGSGPD